MRGDTRRQWAKELGELAEEYDALDDIAAEAAIVELIERELGQSDYLFRIELCKARQERLARRRNAKEPTEPTKLDLSDLIPPVVPVRNPGAAPMPKKSHPLGDKSIVGRRHR